MVVDDEEADEGGNKTRRDHMSAPDSAGWQLLTLHQPLPSTYVTSLLIVSTIYLSPLSLHWKKPKECLGEPEIRDHCRTPPCPV
jgi:hypothetical protein